MYMYKEKRNKNWSYLVFTFFIAVAGSYLAQTYFVNNIGIEENVDKLSAEVNTIENTSDEIYSAENMIEEAMKSVVGISIIKANEESLFDLFVAEKWGLGTGIIVSEDGYILTNQHIARDEGVKLLVNLENGETLQGKVVWTEENIDLALIKVDKNGLVPAKLGNSDSIRIGSSVFAIGNPLGIEFQRTTTSGIISGLNRTLTFEEKGETIFMEDLIQTDASINSGNSGGPLINEKGEVIGVNTVKITTAEGIGFAVPINIVIPVINSFVDNGNFEEVSLGLLVYDKEIIRYVKSGITIESGVYVTSVNEDSVSKNAGIRKGDIIVSIDGVELSKVTDLRRYIYTKKPGEVVSLIVNRNNRIENVKITL